MKGTYKCTNVKFCMEDENQRQAWEYLHTLCRQDGSYGKILSDALMNYLRKSVPEAQRYDFSSSNSIDENQLSFILEKYETRIIDDIARLLDKKLQDANAQTISDVVDEVVSDETKSISEEMLDFACGF